MRNYKKPEVKVLAIDPTDIILASGNLNDMGSGGNLNTGTSSESVIPGPVLPPNN